MVSNKTGMYFDFATSTDLMWKFKLGRSWYIRFVEAVAQMRVIVVLKI